MLSPPVGTLALIMFSLLIGNKENVSCPKKINRRNKGSYQIINYVYACYSVCIGLLLFRLSIDFDLDACVTKKMQNRILRKQLGETSTKEYQMLVASYLSCFLFSCPMSWWVINCLFLSL